MPELAVLQERIAVLQRVVVAFSGGADSAFLAWVANDVLGPDRAVAVTAVSPSLAGDELDDCRALAAEWELRWQTVVTDEVDDPAYAANDGLRCFHCKSALMDAVAPLAAAAGATVVLGVNCDDLGDHRPGQEAAAARGAAFPMVEAGFTKADVRDWSRRLGLRTWDKPAAACLSSRVPYGTAVTVAVLGRVERAEAALRRLGFRDAAGAPLRRRGAPGGAPRPSRPRPPAAGGGRGRGAGRGLPLRDTRSRGTAVREPQPGPARTRTGLTSGRLTSRACRARP